MKTPQEVQVWHILPAIRREFTLGLTREGLKQKEVAKIMKISEPAVSQYLKKKRGDNVTFSRDLLHEIKLSVRKISHEETEFMTEIQKILKKVKDTKFLCSVCHDHLHTDDKCNVCYI